MNKLPDLKFSEISIGNDKFIYKLVSLYLKAKALWEHSLVYSQERMVQGKPIFTIPVVSENLHYTQAIICIYRCALIGQIDKASMLLFIQKNLSSAIEKLLQIHGASGYMEQSTSAQLWLECRNCINEISKEAVLV
jgi:alkylation response protein AidB-like acyl-CoA dehydrogenase